MISRATLKGPLGLSLVSLVLLAVVVLWQIGPVLGAVSRPNLSEDDTAEKLQAKLARHEEHMQTYRDRFTGRSFFTDPKPWPPVTRRTPVVTNDEPEQPIQREPSIPSSYAGSLKPLYPFGNVVYFSNPSPGNEPKKQPAIRVGEEYDGVTVISIDAPRTVRLGWRGGEYDVPFLNFDWESEDYFDPVENEGPIRGLEEQPDDPAGAEAERAAAATDDDADASAADPATNHAAAVTGARIGADTGAASTEPDEREREQSRDDRDDETNEEEQ